jgi:FKBP-type peptidyl-prolyl cis-trans isomerase SlyD
MSDKRVAANKIVSITYSITSPDGTILEQSDLPVTYLHGGNSDLFDKIEKALEGCAVGDEITVAFEPGEAFGPHDPDLTFTDDLANVPPQFQQVGAQVEMQNDQGDTKIFFVTEIADGKLTVDGNHPFAGKAINYRVQVKDVRDATQEELQQGGAGGRMH